MNLAAYASRARRTSSRMGSVGLLGPARRPDFATSPRRGHGRADEYSPRLLLLSGNRTVSDEPGESPVHPDRLGRGYPGDLASSEFESLNGTDSLLEDEAQSRRPAQITIDEILKAICAQEKISLKESHPIPQSASGPSPHPGGFVDPRDTPPTSGRSGQAAGSRCLDSKPCGWPGPKSQGKGILKVGNHTPNKLVRS